MICGGRCVNTSTDPTNCGMCGNVCATGACAGGMCAPPCNVAPYRVLVFGPASGTNEQAFLPAGSMVTVASEAVWRAMTTADFASYHLILIGDEGCSGRSAAVEAILQDTWPAWNRAITGRVVVHGTDPGCHRSNAGAARFLRDSLRWAASGPGTGLWISSDWGRNNFSDLSGFGSWTTVTLHQEQFTISDRAHPIFAGSTDASMSNWGNTSHSYIQTFPASFRSVAYLAGNPAYHGALVREPVCGTPP